MKKEFWDFDENINYSTVNIQGINYKVINRFPDYYTSAKILHRINYTINQICIYFSLNYNRYSKKDQILIDCFCDIHLNNHLLSEMQLGTMFNGLNKPRNLYNANKPAIGPDGSYRAGYRNVFLTLRERDGSFKNWNKIMKLVIHEIAHTMCNHIRWREDDHGKDFKHAEKMIMNAYVITLK